MFCLAKKGAQIIIPLYNTFSLYEYLNILGDRSIYNTSLAYNISMEFMKTMLEKHCQIDGITMKQYKLSASDIAYIRNSVEKNKLTNECLQRLMTEIFWFVITKNY